MSSITSVMLCCNCHEDEALPILQDWFPREDDAKERFAPLHHVSRDLWSGNKVTSQAVLVGCYNYFSTDLFLEHVAKVPWKTPGQLVIIVEDEHHEVSRVFVPMVKVAGHSAMRPVYDIDCRGREVCMVEVTSLPVVMT
jgi:hypothetical protein